jgi:hypothetical protein
MGFIQGKQTPQNPYSVAEQHQDTKDRIEEYKRQADTFDLSPDEKALVLAHRAEKAKRNAVIKQRITDTINNSNVSVGNVSALADRIFLDLRASGYLKE